MTARPALEQEASGWSEKRIGDVGTVKTGSTPPTSDRTLYGHEYLFVSPADMGLNKYINQSQKKLSQKGFNLSRRFASGSVLFVCIGSIGKLGIATTELTSNQQINAVTPGPNMDSEYLYYALGNVAELVKSQAFEQVLPLVNKSEFSDFKIHVPNLPEQRLIASFLRDADDTVFTLERLIAKKLAIKQGMMQQLLTGQIRLPGFAEDWDESVLGDHVVYVKVVALSRAELDSSSELRYLHYGDIHTSKDVRIDAAEIEMPRVAASKVRNAGRLQVGDLVFADASEDPLGVGKSVEVVSVPPEGLVPGLHTIAARFDKSFLADGFKAYLQFIPEFRESLLRLAAGTKVLSTTRRYISSVVLKLPKLAEQQAIAKVLQDVDSEIEVLKLQLKNMREIKQGMMQELLTGRTRLIPTGE